MNAFDLTKADLINGLEKAAAQHKDGKAYGQGMLWNLVQYYPQYRANERRYSRRICLRTGQPK
ncbi:MAG: hypothetical protein ACI8Z1_000634 [Candidatus Azotimanducaceae bacterium]|jgi:hypothetical protein